MNIIKNIIIYTICCLSVFTLSSCATIFSGLKQKVDIYSTPVNAKVTINGEYNGNTPLTTKLPRKKNNIIRIELEGYEPYELVTRKGFNFVTLGNIIFGGAIGMLIDLATGGIFTVNPDPVNAKLHSVQANSTIGIGVVANIPPEMRHELLKIGQLTPK